MRRKFSVAFDTFEYKPPELSVWAIHCSMAARCFSAHDLFLVLIEEERKTVPVDKSKDVQHSGYIRMVVAEVGFQVL